MKHQALIQIQQSKFGIANSRRQDQTITIAQPEFLKLDDVPDKRPQLKVPKQVDNVPKHPLHSQNGLKQSILKAKLKLGPTLSTIMVLQVNYDTISLVERCQAFECSFLLFLIPFAFLLGETLTYFQTLSAKSLSIYSLFLKLIQKISYIQNSLNPQLNMVQTLQTITYLVRYDEHSPQQIVKQLAIFLDNHGQKMHSLIPSYHTIFTFHAFSKYQFIQSIQPQPNVQIKRQLLKEKLNQLQKAYLAFNNEEI